MSSTARAFQSRECSLGVDSKASTSPVSSPPCNCLWGQSLQFSVARRRPTSNVCRLRFLALDCFVKLQMPALSKQREVGYQSKWLKAGYQERTSIEPSGNQV